nr:hypothetical protein [Candidatus Cloacimonadota bacterium]
MRIAFLGPAPPFRGGIANFANHLANEYVKQGHEICFFNFKQQYPNLLFPADAQEDNVKPEHNSLRILTPYLPHTWGKTIKAINKWHPDRLIISWWIPFFALAYGYIERRVKDCHICILAHNIKPHEDWLGTRNLLCYAFEPAEKVVVLSKSCLLELKRYLPSKIVKRAVLGFHPIYDKHVGNTDKINTDPCILFFGLIKEYKGLDVLLEAMPIILVAMPKIRLKIVGMVYGKEAPYREMIQRFKLEKAVETDFRYVNDEEISSYFKQADLCILPYKTATQSGVIATAFSYDTPVVASNVGGLSEYIEDGVNGLLVPPNDPPALAAAVIKFYGNNLLTPMQEAIKNYKKHKTWTELANLILAR